MTNEEKIALGERVRKAREAKKLTQLQLAEGICSDGTVSQLERGQLIPKAATLRELCKKLGITTRDLLKGHEQNMEVDTLLEIIKIHIEKSEFDQAFYLIEELKKRNDLALYQQRTLILSEAEGLLRIGKSEDAIDPLKNILRQLDDENETNHHHVAKVLNLLGTAYFHTQHFVESYHYYKQAYRTSHKFPEFDLLSAQITFNLGNVCTWLGFDTEALAYVSLVKDYCERISNTSKLADTLFSLGLTYHNIKDWENSRISLQQSLALYESINLFRMAERVKHAYTSLVLRQTAPREAIQEYLRSTTEYLKQQDQSMLVYTYALLAMTHLDLDEYDQAKIYLDMAMNFVNNEQHSRDPRYIYVYRVLGVYFFRTKNYESSLQYSSKASELYDKIELPKDAVECLKLCRDVYHETGRKDEEIRVLGEIVEKLEHNRANPYFRQEV